MSAAALVRSDGTTVLLKRHHPGVRDRHQLQTEHAFAAWLRSRGQPVPAVLGTRWGGTVVEEGGYFYEAQLPAPGADIYREALSWSPFRSLGHARSAGAALARFHLAAEGFPDPQRPPGVLINSTAVVAGPGPQERFSHLCSSRPALAAGLAPWPAAEDFGRLVLPWAAPAAELLALLRPCWAHGDWHASNLTWSSGRPDAEVAGVIDLGLSNRTYAVHDLALAIERNCIDWLDLAGRGRTAADPEAMEALVRGYAQYRRLSEQEKAALVAVLPVCHVEHALSEVEYFSGVLGSAPEAALAYEHYLLGHVRWFMGVEGRELLAHLGGVLARPVLAGGPPPARDQP